MLYTAWTTGNCPLWMLDNRDYELVMAFDEGVHLTRDKGYEEDSFALDPMDVIPGKMITFSELAK